ncbi:MAG: 23S rRNA (adenine(2503)-C(2))-methyltransferase RlmN [Planctomycetota bacterium]|nr:MAG: 23S rRNA (adenine(2503)-C(2))-methyltransferase RlmN [Planctomycetota bacterium]
MSGSLLDLAPVHWPAFMQARGGQAFHGRSAARWVFQSRAESWQDMTDLPLELRRKLQAEGALFSSEVVGVARANDQASKLLLALEDGARVESVSMPGTAGRTVCLSTQVGCPVRCPFCASGLEGLERNLRAGEILEQALRLRLLFGDFQRLVVMGMGDAGFNLEATLEALETLLDPAGMRFSARRVTLSTVGPKGALPRLAEWGRPISLALSVHAAEDELRRQLIPGVRKRTLAETLAEADEVFAATKREYTVEYVLLAGVNDHPDQARALAKALIGRRCHVNLIPYNSVPGLPFRRPDLGAQEKFAAILQTHNLAVTLRRSLGGEVDAACGQLRRRLSQPH